MINGNRYARLETGLLVAGMLLLFVAACTIYAVMADPRALSAPREITLEQHSYDLSVGDQRTLTVLVTPRGATTVGQNSWSSSNPQVVAVYPGGIIIAKDVGSAIITVTRGQLTDSCQVMVRP